MNETPLDPYRSFKYLLKLNDKVVGAFSEATIPDTSESTVVLREGQDAPYARKLSSGPVKYGTLSLKRGITNSMELATWMNQADTVGANTSLKDVVLELKNESGKTVTSWKIHDAWPSRYETSGLDSDGSSVLIESLEIQLEAMSEFN